MGDDAPFRILLVEDNAIDVRAALRATKSLTVRNEITVVHDGDQALGLLLAEDQPRPDLVLLDLNLPGRDGHDVLAMIKSHEQLRRIPVVVVTTSSSDRDVLAAYDRGANAYVNKPPDLDGWHRLLATIEGFWVSLVQLPPS